MQDPEQLVVVKASALAPERCTCATRHCGPHQCRSTWWWRLGTFVLLVYLVVMHSMLYGVLEAELREASNTQFLKFQVAFEESMQIRRCMLPQ